jgi:ubiquinone/menaquinone biosynthesis C-methylase UbiE
MHLTDLINRTPEPEPWAEGETIPWSDPDFSSRMLAEHLSQRHDAASRRSKKIDAHIDWIHRTVLQESPSQILDLCCGPGLYTHRLTQLGHICTGIDFGPASIAYARKQKKKDGLSCTYLHQDIRKAEFGDAYNLILLIFGEFNIFKLEDARRILQKAYHALDSGGRLLLEPHTFEAIRAHKNRPNTWYANQKGLFSDQPHLCLEENFWNSETATSTTRYFIVDAKTGGVTRHASTTQAYTQTEYEDLIRSIGFGEVTVFPSLMGKTDPYQKDLCAIVAKKP